MESKMIKFGELDLSKYADGLVPAIVQDDRTLEVLMLGFMDEAAFNKTVETGLVTFYSRTRKTLWTKGETSGNSLNLKSIHIDCDADTLLVRVDPIGPTCHTGARSCFYQEADSAEGFIKKLEGVVQQRHRDMPEGSYTTKLFNKGVGKISQKVGEEAVETIIEASAGNFDAMIPEAADLIYHLLVLLEATGKSLSDIEEELVKRHS
ncbi:MAG: bifunctional phosphoribosyl-AMP cyclohydrolase/phosphoribosyl-ATP diphosphatase HisIE [Rikenellaceae bacterium]